MSEKVTSITPRIEANKRRQNAKKIAAVGVLAAAATFGGPKAYNTLTHTSQERQEVTAEYVKASGEVWQDMQVTFGPGTSYLKGNKQETLGKDELLTITNFVVFEGPDGKPQVATRMNADPRSRTTDLDKFANTAIAIPFDERMDLTALEGKDVSKHNPVLTIDGLPKDADQVAFAYAE